jgi:hypothetical protein
MTDSPNHPTFTDDGRMYASSEPCHWGMIRLPDVPVMAVGATGDPYRPRFEFMPLRHVELVA